MGHPDYVLALDQGTTSSRALLLDRESRVAAAAQRAFEQRYPHPGEVEHDPMEIWATQKAAMDEVLARSGVGPEAIAAIGVANQRETTVVWDRATGRPVHPAIVWQDRRTADVCSRLKDAGHEPWITEKTGLRLDPYFSGTKIGRILDRVDGARERAERGELAFGTVDAWLLWQLTGGEAHATDATNASRTLLCDIATGDWDDALLAFFDVPRAMLPEVRGCSEIFGRVAPGLGPAGVPVAGMAGDQQAALFGQACFEPGTAKNTYGTGCFLLMHTGERRVPSANELLTTVAWRTGDRMEYALEGSVFVGGAVFQWLRDEMGLVDSNEELDRLAGEIDDAGGLYLVPAFTGLGAPYWDPYARGLAIGITRGADKRAFCRAAVEGVAHQIADLIESMERDSGLELRELRVDGGAAKSDPLLQFQADLLGQSVERPGNVETTALGAAYHAGLAVGFWESRDAIAQARSTDRVFRPQRDASDVQARKTDWRRAVERAQGWASK